MHTLPDALEYNQLNDQIYELLKEQILSGAMEPGERLSIGSIARQLGVSATPVRDALRGLQADGLVTVVPRSGTFVSEFGPENVTEVYQTRRILECAGLEHLPDADRSALERLRQIVEQQRSLLVDGACLDYPRFMTLDDQLHHGFVGLLDNSLIMSFYDELHWAIQVTRSLMHTEHPGLANTVAEHDAIVRACEAGEIAEAQRLLRQHLGRSTKDLSEAMTAADLGHKPPQPSTSGSISRETGPLVAAGSDIRRR